MSRPGRVFLHSPGPTNVPDRVLRAMHRACEDFSSPEFTETTRSCLEDLGRLFGTSGEVFAFASVGHGAWEVALANLLDPGDRLFIPVAGRFSISWSESARVLGFDVVNTEKELRRAVDPQAVEDVLRRDREGRIKAVLLVHTETATTTTSDVRAVRAAIDAAGHPALFVVDAIASLAIEPFDMDGWGVDMALTASQKGLMMPPGLAFAALNEKAMAAAERAAYPKRYWDIQFRRGPATYQWFHGTPPLQQIWGLREALDMIAEEGLDNVIRRHARLAGAVRAAVARWAEAEALAFQAVNPEERANAVTAIRTVPGLDPDAVRHRCRDRYNVVLGGGLGDLEGVVFRIGHLGDLNEPMILGALASVELALQETGIPHRPGGVEAAIGHLARDAAEGG